MERSMEQAIREYAAELASRNMPEHKAQQHYKLVDYMYHKSVNHKTQRGAAGMYIRREGCAL